MSEIRKRCRFFVSGTLSDAHTWNLIFLQLLIEEYGHEVINLGACVPQEFLIQQCLLQKPDVLVISSVNGHGHIDGINLINAVRKIPELQHLTVLIGGKLGTRGSENWIYTENLLNAGFNGVFNADTELPSFIRVLESPKVSDFLLGSK
jgi:methylaspartate mutase sigma subunit